MNSNQCVGKASRHRKPIVVWVSFLFLWCPPIAYLGNFVPGTRARNLRESYPASADTFLNKLMCRSRGVSLSGVSCARSRTLK